MARYFSQGTSSNTSALSASGDNVPACCRVVIIGAGMAGLGAARTVIESGVKDVLILEAQDHAGGRVLSWPLNGRWLEAGAQWVHGQENAVWRLANEFDLLAEDTSSEGEGPYLRDDGIVIEPKLVFEVDSVVSDILTNCEKFSKMSSNSVEVPLSIGHYLQCEFIKYLNSCSNDSKDVRRMKEELFDWHVRFQKIDNSSTTLDTLSARSWGNYSFCGGTDYVNFKHGYSSLVDRLTEDLPHGVLRLNTPVTCVHWEQSAPATDERSLSLSPIVVTCSDGSKFHAQHCIVTCSLGFLKEHWRSLFDPVLPAPMIEAIQDMGFATINKIYLEYERPWWEPDAKGFQLVWSGGEGGEKSWTRDLTGFDVLPGGVLLGWVGGEGAELVEGVAEGEVGRQCTALLRRFTGRNDLPEPRHTLRTSWHGNRYVRGGYSHTTSVCDGAGVGPETLGRPVYAGGGDTKYPILLLAGEATHECYFSTTHGAYESGQKQANVILQYHGLTTK